MDTKTSPDLIELLQRFEHEAWASPPTSTIANHVQSLLGEGDHHPATQLWAASLFLSRPVEGVDGFGDLKWNAGPAERGWPWVKFSLDYDGEKGELLMLGPITPQTVDMALHDGDVAPVNGILLEYIDEQLDGQDRVDTLQAIAMDGVAFRERQHHAQHLQQTCGRQAFLDEAVEKGDPVLLRAALGLGAAVNAPRIGGNTALHEAIERGHSDLVEPILGAGAWVNVFNHAGKTPLQLAAEKGDQESCLRLVAAGADASMGDFHGKSPVELAKGKERPGLSL